jgi:hypothetical protein
MFTLLACVLFLSQITLKAQENKPVSHQAVYGLLRSSQMDRLLDRLVEVDAMEGVTFYMGLSRLQPVSSDMFNWSDLDRVFDACDTHGKQLTLVLICGRWIPQWIYDAGAKPIDWMHDSSRVDPGKRQQTAPVPWDAVYLKAVTQAVQAIATRYAQRSCLTRVQITGPSLANGLEANFNLSPQLAAEVGYTQTVYANAWLQMAAVYKDAFPTQQLAWAIHNQFPTKTGRDDAFAVSLRDQLAALIGKRFVVMHCYLTHEAWYEPQNNAVKNWRESAPTAMLGSQLIDIYSAKHLEPALLVQACEKAQAMGSAYVEIFAEDLVLPAYAQAVTAMNQP